MVAQVAEVFKLQFLICKRYEKNIAFSNISIVFANGRVKVSYTLLFATAVTTSRKCPFAVARCIQTEENAHSQQLKL